MVKNILAVILLVLCCSVFGCATSEGLAKGIAKDAESCGNVIWKGTQKADAWIKENLW